jgi:hypothetical protein
VRLLVASLLHKAVVNAPHPLDRRCTLAGSTYRQPDWRSFVKYLIRNAATERLGWILDGLDGQEDWGDDAIDVIAPEFAITAPPSRIVELTRQRSAAYARTAPPDYVNLDGRSHPSRLDAPAAHGFRRLPADTPQ